MTAPVPIAPPVARAVPTSESADQDPGSAASFASALDGALRPDGGNTDRGRPDAGRGVPDHGRPDRPLPRTRGTDSAPGLRAHGRKEDRRSRNSEKDDQTPAAASPAPGADPTVAQVAVVPPGAATPPWTPALGLVPTGPAPDGDSGDPTPGIAVAGAPVVAGPGGGTPLPMTADLPGAVPAVASTPSPALHPAALEALAVAVPQPTDAAVPQPDALPAPLASAPAATALPVVVPAAPVAGAAPVMTAAPTATPTGDLPPAADTSAPPSAAGTAAPTAAPAVRPADVAPAPADPASFPAAAGAAPGAGASVASPATGSGGSASSDAGDQSRQDPTGVPVDTTGSAVAAPLPTVPVAAAAAAATAPPAAAPQPVATQLVQHVAVLADGPDGTRSVTVVLHPDSLGPVQVQVTLSQGSIDLTMRGAHEQGRAALMGALPDLRRDLESAGLSCSNVGVDADTGGSWTAQNGSPQQQAAQQQTAQQWTGQGRGQPEWSDGRFRPWSRPADTGDIRPIPRSRSASPGVDVRV